MIDYNIIKISKVKIDQLSEFYKKVFNSRHKILTNNWKWWYRSNYCSPSSVMINVKKNFLSKEIHKDLFSVIQSDEFAWFHTKTLQKQKTNDIQFCHSLYHSNNVASNYFNTLKPLFDKLNVKIFHRVKLNVSFKDNEKRILGGYHHDLYWNNKPLEELKVAIYYFNTTNGKTLIKENNKIKEIDCVENTLITFPNTLEHTGTTHTDVPFRYVLNVNYI